MVTEYKVTFKKSLSVTKLITIFCSSYPLKIEFMPLLSICNSETLQNQANLTPKMLNLGGKLLEYKDLDRTEFQ